MAGIMLEMARNRPFGGLRERRIGPAGEGVSEDETTGTAGGLMSWQSRHLRRAGGKIRKLTQLFYVSVVKQHEV
jgi:hypothetical protein